MKKKTNIRTMIRQIVREEVAMAIGEVITEYQNRDSGLIGAEFSIDPLIKSIRSLLANWIDVKEDPSSDISSPLFKLPDLTFGGHNIQELMGETVVVVGLVGDIPGIWDLAGKKNRVSSWEIIHNGANKENAKLLENFKAWIYPP